MDLLLLSKRRTTMKWISFSLVAALACCLVPATDAKFRTSMVLSEAMPRVGEPIYVVVRADSTLGRNVTLVAVAPGKAWYDVADRIAGWSTYTNARIPRDGFGIAMTRVATHRWRTRVSFPRPGRWRLLLPNTVAYGVGPLAIETVVVRSRVRRL
jgi:hypothetical protein